MQTRFLTILAAAGIALTTAAFAGQITGTIASVNLKAHSVTLSNGTTYYLPTQFRLDGFRAGDPVSLEWQKKDGMREASGMQAA